MIHKRLIASLLGVFLGACGETEGPAADGSAAADAPVTRNASETRRALDRDFAEVYDPWRGAQVAGNALELLLREVEPPFRLRRGPFIAALYEQRAFEPVFTTAGGLSPRGAAALAAFEAAPLHALDTTTFDTDELASALADYRQWLAALPSAPPVVPTPEELAAIEEILDEPAVRDAADPAAALFARVFPATGESPVPRLAEAHAIRLRFERAAAGATAAAEVAIADAFMAYAFEQKHFNVAWLDGDVTDELRDATIAERMTATFNAMAAAVDEAAATEVVAGLEPHFEQYDRLFAERQRYAAIVAAGGWEEVESFNLRRSQSHPRVPALRRRLAAEGYELTDLESNRWDDTLAPAISLYQETHQLDVEDELNRTFWGSLNISAEDRLAQIELTMQRWRESRIGDDPYYVFINIPDFHAEVWSNGNRDMRFRIVVGNTVRECNPRTNTLHYPNATPIQSARMTYVVLNPYWNIPVRILSEELIAEELEEEGYFVEQGIERVQMPDGGWVIRQRPGATNPLGRVKFMFPNPHDTYLHDTARPQYFEYSVRAFSHGCMRVQNPLDLLEYILTQDGQWDERRVERIFNSNVETAVTLNTPIPVHAEYFVVRVDDNGRANFNSDIYRYDRDRLNPPAAGSLRCTPEVEEGPTFVLDENLRPMIQNEDGTLVDPRAVPADAVPVDPADPAAGDFGP
jgi:murein L,D-transpeptidase YcbB/YkuD